MIWAHEALLAHTFLPFISKGCRRIQTCFLQMMWNTGWHKEQLTLMPQKCVFYWMKMASGKKLCRRNHLYESWRYGNGYTIFMCVLKGLHVPKSCKFALPLPKICRCVDCFCFVLLFFFFQVTLLLWEVWCPPVCHICICYRSMCADIHRLPSFAFVIYF